MVGRLVGVYKNIMMAAGVASAGVTPSRKTAAHTTPVPLYCGSAGMVSVYTMLPLSLTKPDLMSGKSPDGEPFTLQKIRTSDDVWRHLKGGVAAPKSRLTEEGISANSV